MIEVSKIKWVARKSQLFQDVWEVVQINWPDGVSVVCRCYDEETACFIATAPALAREINARA